MLLVDQPTNGITPVAVSSTVAVLHWTGGSPGCGKDRVFHLYFSNYSNITLWAEVQLKGKVGETVRRLVMIWDTALSHGDCGNIRPGSEADCDGNCANYSQERIINVKCDYSHPQWRPGQSGINSNYLHIFNYHHHAIFIAHSSVL